MNPFDNPYWTMWLKSVEDGQRALEFLGQNMQHDSSSMAAVANNAAESYVKYVSELYKHPWQASKRSAAFWRDYFKIVKGTVLQSLGREVDSVVEPEKADFRFQDEAWRDNPYFHLIMQLYLLNSRTWLKSITSMPGLDEKTRRRTEFFVRQIINAASPSNYVLTNPEILSLTWRSRGGNLLKGFERFVKDLERSTDALKISMTDDEAFQLGRNLATTAGKVVYRNELFELIQYEPRTQKVAQTPLLIIPPFVNKYYILDLSEKNSLVRWLLEQGQTVFMLSWCNPTPAQRNIGFDRYVLDGALHAMEMVEKQTGVREINVAGYCIGGTLLLTTLAYIAARKLKSRVKSASLFTTLSDFSDPGDIGVFIDDNIISAIESQNNQKGYFDGRVMAVSFSLLRENSLYWNYFIQNYLKGESPMPFDLLYWNSDSTNITAACHNDMLRKFYIENQLVQPGCYQVNGTKIDLSKIKVPLYFISTHQDHIAKWRITYEGAKICRDNATFVLGESGHIAGIVNPPAKNKYSYWTNDDIVDDADQWLQHSTQHAGSWWLHWNEWLGPYKGETQDAKPVSQGMLEVLEDAPGRYVKRRLGVVN